MVQKGSRGKSWGCESLRGSEYRGTSYPEISTKHPLDVAVTGRQEQQQVLITKIKIPYKMNKRLKKDYLKRTWLNLKAH